MVDLVSRMVERSVRAFGNHKARYVRGWAVDILDWKIPGTLNYWVRMVFDHERDDTKAVYISGDLGEAVVYPTCGATLGSMASCFTRRLEDGSIDVNDSYFIEKVKCSSDLYDWRMDWFKEDLRDIYKSNYGDEGEEGELEDFFDEYCDGYFGSVTVDNGVHITSDGATDKLEEIFGMDYDEFIYGCGRRVSERIVLWLVAMRLAYEQIERAGQHEDR